MSQAAAFAGVTSRPRTITTRLGLIDEPDAGPHDRMAGADNPDVAGQLRNLYHDHPGVVWLKQFSDAREGDPPLGVGGARSEGRGGEHGV